MSTVTLGSVARFFTLSHRYFYCRGSKLCACGLAPASLGHILAHCPRTALVRRSHSVPNDICFLRVFLLSRSGVELHDLIQAFEPLLTLGGPADPSNSLTLTTTPASTLQDYIVHWDGSF